MIKDTRKSRNMIALLLATGIGAVLGEYYIRPTIQKMVKK